MNGQAEQEVDSKPEAPSLAVQQQLGLLNLRLNDMMHELNATVKPLIETNTDLQQENAELKSKLGTAENTKRE